jgi:hypothetical protein
MQLAVGHELTLFKVGACERFDADDVFAGAWHGVSS